MRGIARETGFLLDTADAAVIARRLRELPLPDVDSMPPSALRRAARSARAASYSLARAADRFEHRATLKETTT